jgi:hypothetical protein
MLLVSIASYREHEDGVLGVLQPRLTRLGLETSTDAAAESGGSVDYENLTGVSALFLAHESPIVQLVGTTRCSPPG